VHRHNNPKLFAFQAVSGALASHRATAAQQGYLSSQTSSMRQPFGRAPSSANFLSILHTSLRGSDFSAGADDDPVWRVLRDFRKRAVILGRRRLQERHSEQE
jgi:hypothetical protein